MRLWPPPQWAYDAVVMAVAVVHLAIVIDVRNQPLATLAALAVAALLFRRHAPLTVFLITLPPAAWVGEKVASMLALYSLAYRARRPGVTVGAVAALTLCFMFWSLHLPHWLTGTLEYFYGISDLRALLEVGVANEGAIRGHLYYLLLATVPAILGYLQRTRRDLADQLQEITEAREHEERLLTQQALAAERAQLAREMHDVVSHQVSLIAVQAGALQMQAKDREAKEAASTIRRLSVTTLEELRHMVRVLRASGVKTTELAPQPTIAQLAELVGNSGIEAELEVGALPELDPPLQRAVYRTVQEALTNVRKHAPGATAAVRIGAAGDIVEVEVRNTAARQPVVDLPSSQFGLMGLRQRAELLSGRLDYGPTGDGGWRLRLRVPVGVTSAAP
ncbi:MAG TPA: histidine kinase [Glycomyces sp.]|nr:histidine kinase [Glycomyces sp.]